MERHRDNVGFLRLLFATAVIVGHAPEQLDGNRNREPLTVIFRSLSLGEVAVDAFFMLSGFLITMSWLRSKSWKHYIERRFLRIYPAFFVAYLLTVFIVGPLVGAQVWHKLPETFIRLVALQKPTTYPGQLAGLNNPFLNGSMWTIAYEFRCYLMIALLGAAGALRQHRLLAMATAALIGMTILASIDRIRTPLYEFCIHHDLLCAVAGEPLENVRLVTFFLVGSCFYLFKDFIFPRLTAPVGLGAMVICLLLCYHDSHLARAALATFGAVVLFWAGWKAEFGKLQQINDTWDISYGVYLYGWPIAALLRYYDRALGPVELAALTVPLSLVAGAASWWGLERWTKNLARSRSFSSLTGTNPNISAAGTKS